MTDLEQALDDIRDIRRQVSASQPELGLGPAVLAATGALAVVVGTAQLAFPLSLAATPHQFALGWTIAAIIAVSGLAAELVVRRRRKAKRLSDASVRAALEAFAPSACVGAVAGATMLRAAPEAAWLLPGLWQMLIAVGVFAAARLLPRPFVVVGLWYLLCGMAVLALGASAKALDPLLMAVPFAFGQMIAAWILYHSAPKSAGDGR